MAGFHRGRSNLKLPDDFADLLRGMYEFRGPLNPQLPAILVAARVVGWTDQSVATALGISRERVRQLRGSASPMLTVEVDIPPLPPPSIKEAPVRVPRPVLTDEQAAQLLYLNRRARATGSMNASHPAVVASKTVVWLANDYIQAGYPLTHVAAAMGISKMALHFRLGQHGFRHLAPSQRHGPGPVSNVQRGDELTLAEAGSHVHEIVLTSGPAKAAHVEGEE